MSTVYIPTTIPRALVTNRFVRNGKIPQAEFQNGLATQANQLARWQTKCVFSHSCPIAAIPASVPATTRNRWRFAWRSGPYTRYLYCKMAVAPAINGASPSEPDVTFTVLNGGGSTVGTVTLQYPSLPITGSPGDTPRYFTYVTLPLKSSGAIVGLDPDTEYFGVFSDINGGRLISAMVYEESLPSDTANGYVTQVSSGSPVFDADRSGVATLLRNMWKQGGAHLFNWSVDDQSSPRTIATTTDTNIIDTSITAVSASSPGIVLDFDSKTRISGTGVSCVLKAYAARGSADGSVYLKAADGSTLATVTVTSTAAWYSSGVVEIPSSATGKCDVMFDSGGGTLSLYAVSLYQYQG